MVVHVVQIAQVFAGTVVRYIIIWGIEARSQPCESRAIYSYLVEKLVQILVVEKTTAPHGFQCRGYKSRVEVPIIPPKDQPWVI